MLLIGRAFANPVFSRAAQAIPAGNSPTSRAARMANPETVFPSRDLSVSVVSNFETTESSFSTRSSAFCQQNLNSATIGFVLFPICNLLFSQYDKHKDTLP